MTDVKVGPDSAKSKILSTMSFNRWWLEALEDNEKSISNMFSWTKDNQNKYLPGAVWWLSGDEKSISNTIFFSWIKMINIYLELCGKQEELADWNSSDRVQLSALTTQFGDYPTGQHSLASE